jgi:hypothetical protein
MTPQAEMSQPPPNIPVRNRAPWSCYTSPETRPGCEHVKPTDGVERDYLGRVVKPSKRTSGREIPVDPERLEWFFDREEEDPLLPEGKATFSWDKLSQRDDRNEGWGHENPGHRRRRRRYEGD